MDFKRYREKIIKEYNEWASSRMPKYAERMASGKSSTGYETYLYERRKATLKSKQKSSHEELMASSDYEDSSSAAESTMETPVSLPALEIFNAGGQQQGRVLLLADPGMGKSALFRYKEKTDVERLSDDNRPASIPLRYELMNYPAGRKNSKDLEAQLLGSLRSKGLVSQDRQSLDGLLDDYSFTIMLDGLNEVEGKDRGLLVNDINSLKNKLDKRSGKHVLAVSARIREGWEKLSGFSFAELEPLSHETIEGYTRSVMEDKDKADNFLAELKDKNLESLAAIPLFLFLLCRIYKDGEDYPIPPNRGMVLDTAISHGYVTKHEGEKADPEELERCVKLMAELSFQALSENKGLILASSDIETPASGLEISASSVTEKLCDHGFLEELDHGFYTFWHPVMRDYFAGRKIKEKLQEPDQDKKVP